MLVRDAVPTGRCQRRALPRRTVAVCHGAEPGTAARHAGDGHRSVPARAADAGSRSVGRHAGSAADDGGLRAGVRPGAIVVGPGRRPFRPPTGAARRRGAVRVGLLGRRTGARRQRGGRVARHPRRRRGGGGGVCARDAARRLRAASGCPRDVAGPHGPRPDRDRRADRRRRARRCSWLAVDDGVAGGVRRRLAGIRRVARARDGASTQSTGHPRPRTAGCSWAVRWLIRPFAPGRCWCAAPMAA